MGRKKCLHEFISRTGPRNKTWFDRIITLYNKSNEIERMTGAKIEITIVQGPSPSRNRHPTPLPPCIVNEPSFRNPKNLRVPFHQSFDPDGHLRSDNEEWAGESDDDEGENNQAAAKSTKVPVSRIVHDPGPNTPYNPDLSNYSSMGVLSHGLQNDGSMEASAYGNLPSTNDGKQQEESSSKSAKFSKKSTHPKSFFDDDLVVDEVLDDDSVKPRDDSYFQNDNMISRFTGSKQGTNDSLAYRKSLGKTIFHEEMRANKVPKIGSSKDLDGFSSSKQASGMEKNSENSVTSNEKERDQPLAFDFSKPKSISSKGSSETKSNQGQKKAGSGTGHSNGFPTRKEKLTETDKTSQPVHSMPQKIFSAEEQAIRDSNKAAFLRMQRGYTSQDKGKSSMLEESILPATPIISSTTPTISSAPLPIRPLTSTNMMYQKTFKVPKLKLSIDIPENS